MDIVYRKNSYKYKFSRYLIYKYKYSSDMFKKTINMYLKAKYLSSFSKKSDAKIHNNNPIKLARILV